MRERVDLERLDAAVEAAIRAGGPEGVTVLGFGEITLVIGWPTEAPALAVKRLPTFPDERRLRAYEQTLADWIGALRAAGVGVLDTEVAAVPAGAGRWRAYLLQPLVPVERLLTSVLRSAAETDGEPLLHGLVEAVTASVGREVGLDAQAANWVVGDDGGLRCLDVSTPLLRAPDGTPRLDVGIFTSIYPWLLRPALGPVAHAIEGQYHDARAVLLDAASNLHKERLDAWIPVLLRAAAAHLDRPIARAEVDRYFARDKRLWLLMQRLRRTDRAWQRAVRRRPYPFLLPPPYRYETPGTVPGVARSETPWTTPKPST